MKENQKKEDSTDINDRVDFNSTDAKKLVSFNDMCEGVSRLDSRIAGALAMRKGKILAASNGAGAALPSDEYLSKLIPQAEMMIGIPLANRAFFGDFNFTLVSYARIDTILYYLKNQNVILGVAMLPPYDMNAVVGKIRKLLELYYLPSETRSIP